MNLSRREAIRMGLCFAGTLSAQGLLNPAHAAPQRDLGNASALKRDAELAWRYFSPNLAGVDHGLVPAATWPEGDGYGRYDILTMWDAGSLILAYVSARSIGLIDEKEFDLRIKAVMVFLRRSEFRWGKLTLPNYRTANSGGRTIEPGYDATDTGRFWSRCMSSTRRRTAPIGIKQQVARWNIADTVVNGRLQDIKSGTRSESKCFNYVHYIARAYKLWGIEAARPASIGRSARERRQRTHRIPRARRHGRPDCDRTERDGGDRDSDIRRDSRILSDVLYEAQKERYAETGHLTCVSETPTDAKPWFTYQGYNLDAEAGPRWPVDFTD